MLSVLKIRKSHGKSKMAYPGKTHFFPKPKGRDLKGRAAHGYVHTTRPSRTWPCLQVPGTPPRISPSFPSNRPLRASSPAASAAFLLVEDLCELHPRHSAFPVDFAGHARTQEDEVEMLHQNASEVEKEQSSTGRSDGT